MLFEKISVLKPIKVLMAGVAVFLAAVIIIDLSQGQKEGGIAGCFQGEGVQIVRFNRDCRSPRTEGYFSIPARYSPQCHILKLKRIEAMAESGRSSFSAKIPLSEILSDNSIALEDEIEITLRAPDKSGDHGLYACDGLKRSDVLIKDLLSKHKTGGLEQEKLVSLGDMRYIMQDLPLGEIRWPSDEGGEYKVSDDRLHQDFDDRKIDIYFKTDLQGNVFYSFKCIPWNKRCYITGAPLVMERYAIQDAEISIQHADKIFTLGDNLLPFLNGLYVEDSIGKEESVK